MLEDTEYPPSYACLSCKSDTCFIRAENFFVKSIQQSVCLIAGKFYLNRTYFVSICDQEIRFIVVFSAVNGESIIIQLMPGCFRICAMTFS